MGKNTILIFGGIAAGIAISAMILSGALNPTGAKQAAVPVDEGTAHFQSNSSPTHLPIDVKYVFDQRQKGYDALGTTYLYIDEEFVDADNHCDFCIGVAYTAGANGNATVAFKRSDPVDLTQANTLAFHLRGDTGKEKVVIYALGKETEESDSADLDGIKHVSFAFSKLIELDSRWRSYDIDITAFDRSDITHAFAYQVLGGKDDEKQFVYLDSIVFQVDKTNHAIRLN